MYNETNPQEESSTEETLKKNIHEVVGEKENYEFNNTTIMASLSYLGPLLLIPLLTKRDDSFVLFHIKQGLVVLLIAITAGFLLSMWLYPLVMLIHLALFIFSVIGILNSLQKKEVPLPFIGFLAKFINL